MCMCVCVWACVYVYVRVSLCVCVRGGEGCIFCSSIPAVWCCFHAKRLIFARVHRRQSHSITLNSSITSTRIAAIWLSLARFSSSFGRTPATAHLPNQASDPFGTHGPDPNPISWATRLWGECTIWQPRPSQTHDQKCRKLLATVLLSYESHHFKILRSTGRADSTSANKTLISLVSILHICHG